MGRVWRDSFVEESNFTFNGSVLRKALGERANDHLITASATALALGFGLFYLLGLDSPRQPESIKPIKSITVLPFKPLVAASHTDYCFFVTCSIHDFNLLSSLKLCSKSRFARSPFPSFKKASPRLA